MDVIAPAAPRVTDHEVVFRLPDPQKRFTGVRLNQEIARPRNGPPFRWVAAKEGWVLHWRRPAADRLEYMIEVDQRSSSELILDPANPKIAEGPFGARSVIEWPSYAPPGWIDRPAPPQVDMTQHEIPVRSIKARIEVLIWTSAQAPPDEPLPLLMVNDGPEYARFSGLTDWLAIACAEGRLPPLRAALMDPVDRNQTYSASAAYARGFAGELLPEIVRVAPTPHGRRFRIGMGASLGALAMLHAHRASPSAFGGLFLQSGSFFRQRFDKQESGFARFRRIARFMGKVLNSTDWPHPVPVTMTCGTAEENLTNNRATAEALRKQGYAINFREHPDAHNWTSWRDSLDPALADLLGSTWA